MINLSLQSDREKLEELISDDINLFCETYYEQGHRNHLGASEIGKPCWRMLWYKFRWVKLEIYTGQILRLFNVGHTAEPRFITYLRGIGFEVKEFDDDGKQFRITGANGHFGGSLDGMCKAPARYNLETNLVLLNEFKTNNTGPAYGKLIKEGVQKAKPEHFAQMSMYAYKKQLKYGLYLIENKNDSDIAIKIVELDWNYGAQLEKKAEQIIASKEPPPRISENPASFECKFCSFAKICHNGESPEKNCRSCRNAMPTQDASWTCSMHGVIPPEFIPIGCDDWLAI